VYGPVHLFRVFPMNRGQVPVTENRNRGFGLGHDNFPIDSAEGCLGYSSLPQYNAKKAIFLYTSYHKSHHHLQLFLSLQIAILSMTQTECNHLHKQLELFQEHLDLETNQLTRIL